MAANVNLSRREMHIAELRAKGLTTKQIADKLKLSNHTVRTHMKALHRKFGVSNAVMLCNRMREVFYDILQSPAGTKESARNALRQALRAGNIERKPCEVCGKTPSEGHHENYSEPLKVKWLCKKHHDELHATKQNTKQKS